MKFFEKLEARERILLFFCGLIVILLVIFLGLGKLYSFRSDLAKEVQYSTDVLQRLQYLKTQILSLEPATDLPEKNQFFTDVNNTLKRYQLKPVSINEAEKSKVYKITIRMQSVQMQNLLNFLYDMEHGTKLPISVSSLQMRPSISKKELYDVNLSVSLNSN